MRRIFAERIGGHVAEHFGLAYEMLAPPPAAQGKADVAAREEWLKRCAGIAVARDYSDFFDRWKKSFQDVSGWTGHAKAESRLLIGHGNASGAEIGLTVHRTWGVPVLPGSALKGLLAHYIDAVYGGNDTGDATRAPWQGPVWEGQKLVRPPGAGFAALFGTTLAEPDAENKQLGAGLVTFHDALYEPESIKDNRPFARDVLTVHQKSYYDHQNSSRPEPAPWPTDWDDPVPVGFITVRPGAEFLLALTGPQEWCTCARDLLKQALAEWGVGGKTSAGYGRLSFIPTPAAAAPTRNAPRTQTPAGQRPARRK